MPARQERADERELQFAPGFPLRHATKDAERALSAAHRHGATKGLHRAPDRNQSGAGRLWWQSRARLGRG